MKLMLCNKSIIVGIIFLLFGLMCIFLMTPLHDFRAAVRLSLGGAFVLSGLLLFAKIQVQGCLKILVWVNFLIWVLVISGDPETPYERTWSFESSYFWLFAIGAQTIVMFLLIEKVKGHLTKENGDN